MRLWDDRHVRHGCGLLAKEPDLSAACTTILMCGNRHVGESPSSVVNAVLIRPLPSTSPSGSRSWGRATGNGGALEGILLSNFTRGAAQRIFEELAGAVSCS